VNNNIHAIRELSQHFIAAQTIIHTKTRMNSNGAVIPHPDAMHATVMPTADISATVRPLKRPLPMKPDPTHSSAPQKRGQKKDC